MRTVGSGFSLIEILIVMSVLGIIAIKKEQNRDFYLIVKVNRNKVEM